MNKGDAVTLQRMPGIINMSPVYYAAPYDWWRREGAGAAAEVRAREWWRLGIGSCGGEENRR